MKHLPHDTLWALAQSTLPESEDTAARTHLGACDTCTQALAEVQAAQALLAVLPEPPSMPDALARRVGAALADEVELRAAKRLTGWWPFGWNPGWALAGAAVAIALALLVTVGRPAPAPTTVAPQQVAQQTPEVPAPAPSPVPQPPEVPAVVKPQRFAVVASASKATSGTAAVAKKQSLQAGATVATKAGGNLWLKLPDGTRAGLAGNTQATLEQLDDTRITLDLAQGSLAMVVPHKEERLLVVKAGELEVQDLGTRFLVSRDAQHVLVAVNEGSVEVRSPSGTRTVTAGNAVEWKGGQLISRTWEVQKSPVQVGVAERAEGPVHSMARLTEEDDEEEETPPVQAPDVAAPGPVGTPDEGWAGLPTDDAPPQPPDTATTVSPSTRRKKRQVLIEIDLGALEREAQKLKRIFEAPFPAVDSTARETQVRSIQRVADDGDCEQVVRQADVWLAALPTEHPRELSWRRAVLTQQVRCLNRLGRPGEAAQAQRALDLLP